MVDAIRTRLTLVHLTIRPQPRQVVARWAAILVLVLSSLSLVSKSSASILFPVGIPNAHQPSGMAPPSSNSLEGYRLAYVNNFNLPGLPSGWIAFSGHPGGLPTANFSVRHVTVSSGMLQLKTYRDPAFNSNWTTGGLCQCGKSSLYGAYFVRSRITGPGANSVELLWPYNNSWPPEIDFNENMNHSGLTTSTTHWNANNETNFATLRINMLQWHRGVSSGHPHTSCSSWTDTLGTSSPPPKIFQPFPWISTSSNAPCVPRTGNAPPRRR